MSAQEWFSVKHTPTGTTVTCSKKDGSLSVRWTVKAFIGSIPDGVEQARNGASRALEQLREAVTP